MPRNDSGVADRGASVRLSRREQGSPLLQLTPRSIALAKRRSGTVAGPRHNRQSALAAALPGAALNRAASQNGLFRSFFAAGFECSTHHRRSGWRLDLIHSTAHDQFAQLDYLRLTREGLRVAREGVRWHLVEPRAGHYDFSTAQPIVDAARVTQTQVIWDLCHFGWPQHLDLFSPEFITSLARYGAAFAQWLIGQTDDVPFIVPVNEISFFSWAAADEGSMYPFCTGRGFELKTHLVRATIATMKAIRAVAPQTRFVHVDPVIHVVASPKHPEETADAEAYRLSQFQAWDMLGGRLCPELGGGEEFLDIVGVNFYPYNEWIYNLKGTRRIRKFKALSPKHRLYRPLNEILKEVADRYQRPMLIAETGAEDRLRATWLRYVCGESRRALDNGIPLHAICLYPILNHPGWTDDRHCHNGLWDYPDERGNRRMYEPLASELKRWRPIFEPTARVRGPNGKVPAVVASAHH